jgi:hypothetical protein
MVCAVLEHHAAGFIFRNADDDTPADGAQARWATEIVPVVRERISTRS